MGDQRVIELKYHRRRLGRWLERRKLLKPIEVRFSIAGSAIKIVTSHKRIIGNLTVTFKDDLGYGRQLFERPLDDQQRESLKKFE